MSTERTASQTEAQAEDLPLREGISIRIDPAAVGLDLHADSTVWVSANRHSSACYHTDVQCRQLTSAKGTVSLSPRRREDVSDERDLCQTCSGDALLGESVDPCPLCGSTDFSELPSHLAECDLAGTAATEGEGGRR